jgi:hypothetical protein
MTHNYTHYWRSPRVTQVYGRKYLLLQIERYDTYIGATQFIVLEEEEVDSSKTLDIVAMVA